MNGHVAALLALTASLLAAPLKENPRWQHDYYGEVFAARSPFFVRGSGWMDSLLKSHAKWAAAPEAQQTIRAADVLWADFCQVYPVQSDWLIQDRPTGVHAPEWGEQLVRVRIDRKLVANLVAQALAVSVFADSAPEAAELTDVTAGLAEYERIRLLRRDLFLKQIPDRFRKLVFVKIPHTVLSGSNHFAYTESLSDHPFYRTFKPGGALCVLTLDHRNRVAVEDLLSTTDGSIRDPEVSFDGQRVLFSMRNSGDKDDYHLYEMDLARRHMRQLTEGLGHADYEAIYAPNGHIVFNSTRCVQTIACDRNVVSNLYTCDPDGRFMRRLGFEQATENYPKLLPDGRVVYTRWEYNDRSQVWPQPLFVMNPDGTMQTEYYGNNSWFPTSILHARPIPGTRKLIAIIGGHHAHQKGKLAIIDTKSGNQGNEGILLVAPESKPDAAPVDIWGTEGDQFKHPYAIDENLYVVSCSSYEGFRGYRGRAASAYEGFKPFTRRTLGAPFWLYLINRAGERELLVADGTYSCLEAVPLAPRIRPPVRPSLVDYRKKDGVFYVQDIYVGPGLEGVERGAIRGIRVVELLYRHYPVGKVSLYGPGRSSASHSPAALNNGTYDAKRVLGEARVYEDGSAYFRVPARRPVYFQAIDHNGHAAQTMRSWATLQPGESFGCIGCHESKYDTPLPAKATLALAAGPQELEPFYGPPRPFSFPKEIQPILDQHCVSCHSGRRGRSPDPPLARIASPTASHFFRGDPPPALNDEREPRSSADRSLPRFTFWPHKGAEEWVQYSFKEPTRVSSVAAYWFDTGPDGPWCRKPEWWKLIARDDGDWQELGKKVGEGVCKDTYDTLTFEPVAVRELRIVVKLPPQWSGGILEWRVGRPAATSTAGAPHKPFSLRGDEAIVVPEAKRKFSDSYLYFCSTGRATGRPIGRYGPNSLVNWLNVQGVPTRIPAYHAGAARSRLITMLKAGHNRVRLSQQDMDKIACWIDLLVPYCGDYRESHAWSPRELADYEARVRKRDASEARERENIQAFVHYLAQGGRRPE